MSIDEKIESNEKLIYHTVRKYFPELVSDEDILQIGRIGLWKACEHFCPERGLTFSTFAVACIRHEIRNELHARCAKRRSGDVVSLDEQLELRPHDTGGHTRIDCLVGAPDVGWVDLSGFLSRLTPKQRELVTLRLSGYSFAEVDRIRGTSRNTTRSQLMRMRAKFNAYV